MKAWLTVAEAAKYLNVSTQHVHKLRRQGALEARQIRDPADRRKKWHVRGRDVEVLLLRLKYKYLP